LFVGRSELTKNAEKASISVFAANLKQLLLTPPVRGKSILGIDPGFHNGCKFAVISATGKCPQHSLMQMQLCIYLEVGWLFLQLLYLY